MERSLIESQPKGSDIHGLLERVAYFIYSKRIKDNKIGFPITDWSEALSYVFKASSEKYYPYKLGSPELYHHTLEVDAQEIHSKKGCDERTAWYKAQDKLAKLIFDCIDREK